MPFFNFYRWYWRRPFFQLGFGTGLLSLGCLYEAFRGIVLRDVSSIIPTTGASQPLITGHDALITGLKWLCGAIGLIAATIFLMRLDSGDSELLGP